MPTIWEDKYLQNHTKKELNALRDSYDNAEWVCPRCEAPSPVWNGMTVISGSNSFGTEYRVNLYCYDCDFKRKNSKLYNLKPGEKYKGPRKIKPTDKIYLRFNGDKMHPKYPTKVWDAQLYKSSKKVVTRWGRAYGNGTGTRKEFTFKTEKEAVAFFEKKVAEKLKKGYYDPFYSMTGERILNQIGQTKKVAARRTVKSRA